MKTWKLASVTIPAHYTLSVIMTDEKQNRFRVYKEWRDEAFVSPDGKYCSPKYHKHLLERYASLASAMYLVYQHTAIHNIG